MKKNITLNKIAAKDRTYRVKDTPEKLLGYVWELTEELCSLGGRYNAQQRLQRHIVSIKRRKS